MGAGEPNVGETYDDAQHSDEAQGQFILALRTRGLRSQALLNAVERAPRTQFIAPEHIGFAYHNISLPLPCGQETSRPLAVVEAVHALDLKPHHRVLEIGTGSGWQTALLAGLAGAVASMERWQTLAERADERLQELGFTNAVVVHGDGEEGLPSAAPFDRIIFNVAIAEVPEAVLAQVAEDGVILASLGNRRQTLTRLRPYGGGLTTEPLGPAELPLLVPGVAENL